MQEINVIKPEVCPHCGSKSIAKIIYGKAHCWVDDPNSPIGATLKLHSDLEERFKAEEIILGGCILSKNKL